MGYSRKEREALQGYVARGVQGLLLIGDAAGPLEAHNIFAQRCGFQDYAEFVSANRSKVIHKHLNAAHDVEAAIYREVMEKEKRIFSLKPINKIDRQKIGEIKRTRLPIKRIDHASKGDSANSFNDGIGLQ